MFSQQSAHTDAIMVGHVNLPTPAVVPLDGKDILVAQVNVSQNQAIIFYLCVTFTPR